jgi:hypothetical protein
MPDLLVFVQELVCGGARAEAYDHFKKWDLAIKTFNTAIAVEDARRKREPDNVLVRRELADYYAKQAAE